MMEVGRRNRLLEMIRILQERSDEDHPIRTAEIIDEMRRAGINTERKTVYRNIEILRDAGFDIIETRTPEHGYFLASRDFEEVEIRLLIDAVLAASFITQKKTDDLVKKLTSLVSTYQAGKLRRQIFIDNRVKSTNEYIYYGMDCINAAIEQNKRITLTYTKGKSSREFEISPYAMAWNKDKFYLIGNIESYDNLLHLRLDRIYDVKILNKPSRPFSEVCSYRNHFDSADYIARHINMFGGEPEPVEFLCTAKGLELLGDQFGSTAAVRPREDGTVVRVTTATGLGLVGFLMQCGSEIKVLSPQHLALAVRRQAEAVAKMYDNVVEK